MAGHAGGGNAETLRRYWAEGEGAAKIGWGTPGDFDRCVGHLEKYMPGQAKGFCNLLHHRALGYYPATHAKMAASHGRQDLLGASVALGIARPEVLALAGSWNSMLHPRIPAGQAGGGKFTAGSGGGAAKSKGAKGKGSAAAQAKAQAGIIYPQFLKMSPQDRAAFLAKLSDPQLKALYSTASQGNSNDPITRAALIAIKDQMAARSLTGAKGPTAINKAKAAVATKKASSAKASAAKKASAASTSAAKKTASANTKSAAAAAKNQGAAQKAKAAMAATTQKAQVAGLTSALKSASDPKTRADILAQLKTVLGLAQTASRRDVLALAIPAATSGDGPVVTVNADLKNPAAARAALKKLVKAHGRVPAAKQPAFRKKVTALAKKHGHPDVVPDDWNGMPYSYAGGKS